MVRAYIKQKFAVNRQVLSAVPEGTHRDDLLFEYDWDACNEVIRKGYPIGEVIKTLASFAPSKNDEAVAQLRRTLRMLARSNA